MIEGIAIALGGVTLGLAFLYPHFGVNGHILIAFTLFLVMAQSLKIADLKRQLDTPRVAHEERASE